MTDARAPRSLRAFVTRWEMAWHGLTLALYLLAIATVVLLFPDVSNMWVSIFVLIGSFTAAMAGMISAIKSRGEER